MNKKTVVIVGGGFGGIKCTLDLLEHTGDDLKIIIIDKDGYHSYPSDWYKVAASSMGNRVHFSKAQFRLLFSTVTIPIHEIFEGKENVELCTDEVVQVDYKENKVKTASESEFEYDWLVLAVGSVTNFYGIPGLSKNALTLKSTEDALNIRNSIDEIFAHKAKHDKVSIVIGGGGFSGVEVAGELAVFAKKLARIHGYPIQNIEIIIVEASPCLLGGASEWTRKKAEKRLESLGVQMFFESPVTEVVDGRVSLKGGHEFYYDVLVWTAGVKANPLVERISGAELLKGGCVATNSFLQVDSLSENIFAVGDISFCKDFKEKPLAMTAQTALSQGKFVAYTIKRMLHGRKTFSYTGHKSKFLIPVGGRWALAEAGQIKFSGFVPWALKRLVALKHFMAILPWHKAILLWWKGEQFDV